MPTSRSPVTPQTSGRGLGPRASSTRASSVSSRLPQTPTAPLASQLRTPFTAGAKVQTEISARATDDFDDHVIAAIDTKDHDTVGCAYYSAEEEKMYMLGDTRFGGMETVDACQ